MKKIFVVVGILENTDGQICISKRQDGQHLAGFWEFPGGKIDEGEKPFNALVREFEEELGVTIKTAEPWFDIEHDYGEKMVHLDIWRVTSFEGEAFSKEGQLVSWVGRAALGEYEFPSANEDIVKYLKG